MFADAARTLYRDQAIGAVVLDGRLYAGLDGQLFRGEEFLAVDLTIDDPLIDVALAGGGCYRDRFEIMVILEVRINVARPIELVYQVIEVMVSCRGHVLDQERPGHRPAFHE